MLRLRKLHGSINPLAMIHSLRGRGAENNRAGSMLREHEPAFSLEKEAVSFMRKRSGLESIIIRSSHPMAL